MLSSTIRNLALAALLMFAMVISVARAEEWKWSSVRAHLANKDDGLAIVAPVLQRGELHSLVFQLSA